MGGSDEQLERHQVAARIVDEAGGELVGRTKLQKVTCLAWLAGLLDSFTFEYRNFGPFSERLAGAMEIAAGLGFVEEEERRADWGGWYSIYRSTSKTPHGDDPRRRRLITEAAQVGPIELELLATAAFLNRVEKMDAGRVWDETARRKPGKAADGRLDGARQAYGKLRELPEGQSLPAIA